MDTFDALYEAAMKDIARGALAAGAIGAAALGTNIALKNRETPPAPVIQQTTEPSQQTTEPSQQTTVDQSLPRGLRNNNPGNIEIGDDWEGMTGHDARFVQFREMEWGVRAFGTILKNYKILHGIQTLEGTITRWAPPKENDTEKYIKLVSKWSGIPRDQEIDLADPQIAYKLIKAMTRMENGQTIDDETIRRGLGLIGKKYLGDK
jgi:hypothetical protein